MMQGKTIVITLIALVIGLLAGFMLRPIIAPTDNPVPVAISPAIPAEETAPRGVQFFLAHIDEARMVSAGCRDGSVRGGECATAQEAIMKVEARESNSRFLGKRPENPSTTLGR